MHLPTSTMARRCAGAPSSRRSCTARCGIGECSMRLPGRSSASRSPTRCFVRWWPSRSTSSITRVRRRSPSSTAQCSRRASWCDRAPRHSSMRCCDVTCASARRSSRRCRPTTLRDGRIRGGQRLSLRRRHHVERHRHRARLRHVVDLEPADRDRLAGELQARREAAARARRSFRPAASGRRRRRSAWSAPRRSSRSSSPPPSARGWCGTARPARFRSRRPSR